MNKRGQYRRQPQYYQPQYMPPRQREPGVHWLLILGVLIFVVPFFGPVIKINFPGFVGTIGIVLIVVGAIFSILKHI